MMQRFLQDVYDVYTLEGQLQLAWLVILKLNKLASIG